MSGRRPRSCAWTGARRGRRHPRGLGLPPCVGGKARAALQRSGPVMMSGVVAPAVRWRCRPLVKIPCRDPSSIVSAPHRYRPVLGARRVTTRSREIAACDHLSQTGKSGTRGRNVTGDDPMHSKCPGIRDLYGWQFQTALPRWTRERDFPKGNHAAKRRLKRESVIFGRALERRRLAAKRLAAAVIRARQLRNWQVRDRKAACVERNRPPRPRRQGVLTGAAWQSRYRAGGRQALLSSICIH